MPINLPKKRILSIDVSYGTYNEFVKTIIEQAAAKISSYVCVANVHMLVEAYHTPEFQKVVNNAYLVTPDGMPLAKGFKAVYDQHQDRVNGMSLLPSLLNAAEKQELSVFFYGSTELSLQKTADHLKVQYPKLKISGMYSPPFKKLSEDEMDEIAKMITEADTNIVFVVLGCPKQEIWMNDMQGKIPALMIGVGGALSTMIGENKRAPQWMQENSLEWLYRLTQEPTRLFSRYLKTNSQFLYLVAKENMKKPVNRYKWRTE